MLFPRRPAARRGAARALLLSSAALGAPALLGAQRPVPPPRDTVRADSSGVQPLPGVTVSVTRDARPLARVPWAVGMVGERELRRGQLGIGLDEALTSIPGVYVANRHNFALDQRVTVRGFGTRANFGVRGVQVVLDGIPQTLPDGQSQLSNVELGLLSRAEVLRGPASSLYGNGAGGVLSFSTDLGDRGAAAPAARVEGGSNGLLKWQARAGGARGRATGAIAASRLTWDNFRPHGSADVRNLAAGGDIALGGRTFASARAYLNDTPEALNPGPLTAAEFAADPDVAAPNNVLRGADKRVRQGQLSLRLRRAAAAASDVELDASVFALTRDLRNAIASPPPGPFAPEKGTYITLDRTAWGARVSAARALGARALAPRLTAGVDWRWMEDRRANFRATAGRPTAPDDTLVLRQDETVWALGPFAQLEWAPDDRLLVSAGGRWDRVRFAADDLFRSDGDASGERTLPAWSGHLGASYAVAPAFAPYATLSTAFETPTTVELQEGSIGGFARDLGPQRAVNVEVGARGATAGGRLSYSAALFRARVSDAIVQYEETGGRAFFRNAGAARHDGLEVGVGARASERLALDVAYTWARYRFTDYRVERGDEVVAYDGNAVPGVPEHFLRLGLRTRPFSGATLDLDHVVSSAVWADDANTTRVEGWGPGITSARATWRLRAGGVALEPFAGVQNLSGRRYVSSVVVNGFGGRVREPAPGRSVYFGVGIGG